MVAYKRLPGGGRRAINPAFRSHEQIAAEEKRKREVARMTRNDMFRLGYLTVEDMDDEELRYGRMRESPDEDLSKPTKYAETEDLASGVAQRRAELVPKDLYEKMVQEHMSRTNEKLRQQMDTALETMVEIMTDKTVEPADRFKASQYLFERVAGKTVDKVSVTVQKAAWEEVFEGIAAGAKQRVASTRPPDQDAIDAEVIGDDQLHMQQPPQPPPQKQASPYGHIQVPNIPGDQNLQDTQPTQDDYATQQYDNASTAWATSGDYTVDGAPPLTTPQQVPPLTTPQQVPTPAQPLTPTQQLHQQHGYPGLVVPAGYGPNVQPIDLGEDQKVPEYFYQPPHKFVPRAPDYRHPINTMSTAPPPHYVTAQAQEQFDDDASVPLSQQLRDNRLAAEELAAARKERKEMHETAKKARTTSDEGIARTKAKGRRIVQRTLGLDAMEPIDMRATFTPVDDSGVTGRVTWTR